MATLRNKRKLAAVSRETPDSSRGRRGQKVLDPELTQDYISQVSEEIEGRVTKKLFEEFNKTESRILGALSKLDEFLLNPQVRTCSVVQEASGNANSENREIHGDRYSNDPYPEGGYFPHHSGHLKSPEADMVTETYPHSSHCLQPSESFFTNQFNSFFVAAVIMILKALLFLLPLFIDCPELFFTGSQFRSKILIRMNGKLVFAVSNGANVSETYCRLAPLWRHYLTFTKTTSFALVSRIGCRNCSTGRSTCWPKLWQVS